MRRWIIFVALCVLALAIAWSVWRGRAPMTRTPVTATLLNLTNDASGMRHATLRVVNGGTAPVVLLPIYALQNRLGLWRTNDVPRDAGCESTNLGGILPFHPRARNLQSGQAYEVTLALPFDGDRWRASFWYIETQQPVIEALKYWGKRVGFSGKEAAQPIAYTDWSDR